MNRWFALLGPLIAIALFSGCAGVGPMGSSGPAAEAPTFRVGDRWVYRATDGFRVPVVWDETHEVTAVAPDRITVRVTQKGPTVNNERVEIWTAAGSLATGAVFDEETRRFTPPAKIYEFPLAPGNTWNQWVSNFNQTTSREGEINRYVKVGGWEKVMTPAGAYDAIRLRVLMRLDDGEFWREPTTCNYLLLYAPAVGATVREEKNAEYREKGDQRDGIGAIPAQHAVLELVSYARGTP
jgi:hypothetical protein